MTAAQQAGSTAAGIAWPAVIHYAGSDALAWVASEAAWGSDPHWHAAHYLPDDRLIDSLGRPYLLTSRRAGCVTPLAAGSPLPLEEVLGLVRRHAAQDGACCVAKLSAATIREALAMVAEAG